jgi:hypothetical protein
MAAPKTIPLERGGNGPAVPSSLDAETLVIVRPNIRGDLDELIVEEFRPYHKRRLRTKATRLWQIRIPLDRMVTDWIPTKQGRWKRVQVPHPRAGKVIATLSAERLYGIAPGTPILFQHKGEWIGGRVGEYQGWKPADERRQARARHQDLLVTRRDEALARQPERLAREKARRRARIPSRYQRLVSGAAGIG